MAKTVHQKKLQGTYRPDRDNLDKPLNGEIVIGMDAPDFFDETEKRVWDQVMPELKKVNLLYSIDILSLVILCQELGAYFRIHSLARGKLAVIRGGKVECDNEIYKLKVVQKMHLTNAKELMINFGLTPQARQKLQMALIDPAGDREPNRNARQNVLPPKPGS